MALASGNRPDRPLARWRRLLQWLGFVALLGQLLATGLMQCLIERWFWRNQYVS